MKTQDQAQMFANRLQKRMRHLKKWAKRTGADVFRLYDRDIPEIPLVLDIYGDAIAGALYKRPYEKSEAEEEKWLSAMKDAAAGALGIKSEHIFLKQRQRQKGTSQYEKMSGARFEKIVKENGLSFKVNLSDYLDTGLFPDRRLLRAHIRGESAGKRVLNLFSYTGSFSVYAAAGGAASTDSIDISNTYLDWSRENFSLNALSSSFSSLPSSMSKNNLIRADVLKFLEKAVTTKTKWDIIILDPPAFSNSKKMENNFDLKRDINMLVNQCIFLLAKSGKLFLSLNVKHSFDTNFAIDMGYAPRLSGLRITDLSNKMTDVDFIGKKIPQTFLLECN